MRSLASVLALAAIAAFTSCTRIYAQAVSARLSDDLLAIPGYSGRIVERGLRVPDAAGSPTASARRELVEDIVYQKPWKLRAEVVEPADRRGELFAYDGTTICMWFPGDLLGIRIRGATAPTDAQVRRILEEDAVWALKRYDFSYRDDDKVAGRATTKWAVTPSEAGPFRHPYESWVDKQHSLALKVLLRDAPDHLWYGVEYERIAFGATVEPSAFTVTFPSNAVVFEWDLSDPGAPLLELQRVMNFDILLPSKLPEGHTVRKIVKGRHQLPMLIALMDHDGRWLSLSEMRAAGHGLDDAVLDRLVGIPVSIGGRRGIFRFLGSLTSLSWNQGNTALTLIGNLPYPEMVELAASVGAPPRE